MSQQFTCIMMQSPSLNARAPKTSTIFILSETWHNKHKRLNNQIFYDDIVCAVCTLHTNLKWPQERNTLDEGLIHPPLFCVIFNNQSVKCGSILKENRGFNLSILSPVFDTLKTTMHSRTHQAPQGTLLCCNDCGSSRRVVHESQLAKTSLVVVLPNAHICSVFLH